MAFNFASNNCKYATPIPENGGRNTSAINKNPTNPQTVVVVYSQGPVAFDYKKTQTNDVIVITASNEPNEPVEKLETDDSDKEWIDIHELDKKRTTQNSDHFLIDDWAEVNVEEDNEESEYSNLARKNVHLAELLSKPISDKKAIPKNVADIIEISSDEDSSKPGPQSTFGCAHCAVHVANKEALLLHLYECSRYLEFVRDLRGNAPYCDVLKRVKKKLLLPELLMSNKSLEDMPKSVQDVVEISSDEDSSKRGPQSTFGCAHCAVHVSNKEELILHLFECNRYLDFVRDLRPKSDYSGSTKECYRCNTTFSRRGGFVRHMREVHGEFVRFKRNIETSQKVNRS